MICQGTLASVLLMTIIVNNLQGASTQTSLCVQRDPLQHVTDFNGGSPHPARCKSQCAGKEFYGVTWRDNSRTGCFCGDDIPPSCPGTCSRTCGGVPCGAPCDACTPPFCVSAYTVTPSAYPKCTSGDSWTDIGTYPGGTENGFPIASAVENCQEACRTGPGVTGTFSGVLRNGGGPYARCYCGDEDQGDSAGMCTLVCGGEACGGPDGYKSVYPACLEGTYGQNCESDCRVSCPDNVCDVTIGFCPRTCPVGTYGIFCNLTCPQNCDSNECQSYSGECSKGCKDGHFGSKCEFNCSSTCLNSRCDQDTSVCSGCIVGFYGDNCTDTCANCFSGCAQSGDGKCDTGGCKLGYHGDYCNKNCSESCLNRECEQDLAVCVGCVPGKHAPYCNISCSETCLDRKCNQNTAKCDGCQNGYYGDQCTSGCFCVSNCNQDSGICNPGGCIDGYFSPRCDQNCSTTCLNRKCDQSSARCEGCEKDYYGDNCTQQCLNCGNGCNQTDGYCIDGCKDGHYSLTCDQNCSLSCEAKRCDIMSGNCTVGCQDDIYYGSWCNKNCSQNCSASQCDRDSGHCNSCDSGLYTLECDMPCPGHCRKDQCERMFGNCTNGCKDGWQGDICIEKVPGGSLGAAAIAGICVACVVLIVGVIVAVIFIKRKKGTKAQSSSSRSTNDHGHLNPIFPKPDDFLDFNKPDDAKPKYIATNVADETEADAGVYENPVEGKLTVSTGEFHNYVRIRKQIADYFDNEYSNLNSDTLYDWHDAKRDFGEKKNRYRDIYPYDYNRVVLETLNNDPLTDYINASRIQGYFENDKFIACLGPQLATVDDFWRMIWQEKFTTIVMLTNLMESMVEKCVLYWPKDKTKSVTFKDITISLVAEDNHPTYSLRKFRIQKGDHKRQVCQYHFTVWPDHGVPTDPTALLSFRRKVLKRMVRNVPMVIHCSAGVGRTGTFIAMDYLIKQAANEGQINVFDCVNNLRHQRKHLIQNFEQYEFLHEAVAQQLTLGETTIPSTDFRASFDELLRSNGVRLQLQFKTLRELAPKIKSFDRENALSSENKSKNRDEKIIPHMSSCVYLTSRVRGRNNYINAVLVDGFLTKKTFMVTQLPLESTIVDFWRMVTDHNSNCIVILQTKDQAKSVPYFLPAKNKPMDVLEEVASVRTSLTTELYRTVDISLHDKPGEDSEYANRDEILNHTDGKRVRVYELTLTGGQNTVDYRVVLDVFTELQKWRADTGSRPVTVTCLDGARYSGQFVACCNLFEIMQTDNEVDVFQVAKYVRDSRPEFINSVEQYQGLYEAASMYLTQFATYANFQ